MDFSIATYFSYGSGNYFQSTSPVDPYGIQTNRVLADRSVLPKNDIAGKSLQRLDFRFSKEIRVVGRVRLSGVAEVFNVFNHANYGAYNGLTTSPTYGQPQQATSTTYQPRLWQLGFRMAF
jgi:hypothetical protein